MADKILIGNSSGSQGEQGERGLQEPQGLQGPVGPQPPIEDNLESTAVDRALSANQGRELNAQFEFNPDTGELYYDFGLEDD